MKNKRCTLKLLSAILCLALLAGTFAGFSVSAAPDLDYTTSGDEITFDDITYVTKAHLTEKYFQHTATNNRVTMMGDAVVGKQVGYDQRFVGVYGCVFRTNGNNNCSLTNSFVLAFAWTASGRDMLPDGVGSKDAIEGEYQCKIEYSLATANTLRVEGFIRLQTIDGHFYLNESVSTARF